tara:strand:- start:121324 stop:121818 length:495 start_codon:yes stop_codon:yes gene_type:complete
MYYFAYGSNMSLARLSARAPSAVSLGCYVLWEHDLRFHKSSEDGSGKCDAYFTSNSEDSIYGVLFTIGVGDKSALDRIEGLGYGYDEKKVIVIAGTGARVNAITYVATNIDESLSPYTWYANHVLVGAREAVLPGDYIQTKIEAVVTVEDYDRERDARQRAVHS